jgi:hypothetical protein
MLSAKMSRRNSLYVDVMGVENIVSAIDRAEEQLFAAIETAMACNIPSDRPADVPAAPAAPAAALSPPEPRERSNAYSALAARVGHEAVRKKAAHEHVVELDIVEGDVVNVGESRDDDVQIVEEADATRISGWKRALQPARSSLANKASASSSFAGSVSYTGGRQVRQVQNRVASGSVKPEIVPHVEQSAKSKPRGAEPVNRNDVVRERMTTALTPAAPSQVTQTPLPAAYASAPASIVPKVLARPTPLTAPGVFYVPGVDAVGMTLPNGYRETSEGLRPVVTLAQRPRVPLALRQTLADKVFAAVKARGVPDMDAIVESTCVEQRCARV